MREVVKHASLLAASLVLLAVAITDPCLSTLAFAASLVALYASRPNFGYPYPQNYARYDYVYRRYAVRALAVAYSAAVAAAQPSVPNLALAILVLVYAPLSLAIGESAAVPALLSLLVAAGLEALPGLIPRLATPCGPFLLLLDVLCLVAAPAALAIYYTFSKYYEGLYELGRVSKPRFSLSQGMHVSGALLFAGLTAAGVAVSLYVDPLYLIPTAFAAAGLVGFAVSAVRSARGTLWSYASYGEDFSEEASRLLLDMLAETGWGYTARPVAWRRGVKVYIYRPFTARIVVREWRHRAYLATGGGRIPVHTGSGTVIEASPGPRRAPAEFRQFMARFLEALRLDAEAAQWRP